MSQTQVQLVGNVTTGGVFAGIVTATAANIGEGVVGINSTGINVSGVVTATSFSGDGSGLTGVGVGASDNINTTILQELLQHLLFLQMNSLELEIS